MVTIINRLIWQLNRSPLRTIIKSFVRLANLPAVRSRESLASQLLYDAEVERLVNQLKTDGYCMVTKRIDRNLLEDMASLATAKLNHVDSAAQQQSQLSKPFWVRLLDEEMQDGKIRISSPYVRFAIQPAVLQIASRFLGQIPRLDYVLLTLSQFSPQDFTKSQLWHFDYDDLHVIKLFAYLTDVKNLDDGPFTFVPAPASSSLGYSLRSHRTDQEIFGDGRISRADVKSLTAPALTVFMVDTARCLHMGSRLSEGHQRLLYTATYTTVPSMFPTYKTDRFIKDREFASDIERMALES